MRLLSPRKQSAYTLIEVAVVIGVLVAFVTVFFVVIAGYRAGVQRAQCILNRSNIQKGVRSVSSMYSIPVGGSLPSTDNRLVGTSGVLPQMLACTSSGAYAFTGVVPAWGTPYVVSCGAGPSHDPLDTQGW